LAVRPGVGRLSLSGPQPTPLNTVVGVGELLLVGPAPVVLALPSTVVPGTAALTLTGPAITTPVTFRPGVGELALAGPNASLRDTVEVSIGGLTLQGLAPVAVADIVAQPGAGQLSLTGPAPTADTGGGAVTSLSEFATANSSTESLTLPANINEGDLILFLNRSAGFGSVGTGVPSGFTSIDLQSPSGTQGQQLSYKIAAGTEGGTSINGLTGSGNDFRNACIVVRGDNPITAVNVLDIDGDESNGAPSDQTITSGGGTPPLAVVGAMGSSGAITPSFSTTEDSDARTADDEGILLAKYYNASPANTVVGMNDGGSFNCLQSCYIECS